MAEHPRYKIVVLTGPTGSGKSAISELIWNSRDLPPVEILTIDSRQIYKHMDIGTDKPSSEMQKRIPHHLLDIVEPDREFSVAEYRERAGMVISEICGRGHLPILVGGTGLYIRVLLRGLIDAPGKNPELRERLKRELEEDGPGALHRRLSVIDPARAGQIEATDGLRIIRALEIMESTPGKVSDKFAGHGFHDDPYDYLLFVLSTDRSRLYTLIDQRVERMISNGLFDEVAGLVKKYGEDAPALSAIGYRQIAAFLANKMTRMEAIDRIKRDSRRYAKRQITWFKKEPRAEWMEHDPLTPHLTARKIIDRIKVFLK
jgi:tRNA dimethylallyltransferase